jgi:ABC-type antimicrobial peptide transport system permease subunit
VRVIALFLRRVGTAAALGLTAGLAGAYASSRFLAPYLFATNPADPMLYAGAAAVLVIAALVATWVPARRASRMSPASVLRDS